MATQGRTSTRADALHQRLRADILNGRLSPGQRLKFQALCGQYDTSVGAAREALTKLVSEGLVRVQPHQGYTVTPLSHEDLQDLTQARVEIESLALRLSVDAGDMQWEAELVAAHHVLERTPFLGDDEDASPSEQWADAHTRFHFALIAACPNRRLLALARTLREEAALYQLWSVSFRRDPHRDGAAEHLALRDAAIARDADLSVRLIREHLERTAALLTAPEASGVPS